jgi:hypothetical protein
MGVLGRLCVCADTRPHALKAQWSDARRRRGGPVKNAGQPDIAAVPPELEEYANKIRALPRLQAGLDGMAVEVHMVEISRVCAYQAGVFLDRVFAAEQSAADPGDLLAIAEMCLPLDVALDPSTIGIEKGPPLRMVSTNANARVVLTGHGGPDPANGLIPVAFFIGESEPCVQVVEFKGKFYLRNGYHRLVGAMRRGVTHVPALVMQGSKWEDVNVELGQGWFFDARKLGADMPTMRHFEDGVQLPLRVFETVTEFGWRSFPRPI